VTEATDKICGGAHLCAQTQPRVKPPRHHALLPHRFLPGGYPVGFGQYGNA